MIHYSCDRCGCSIDKTESVRYSIKIEMEAKLNVEHSDNCDNDQDSLLEMDQMLEQLEHETIDEIDPIINQSRTYDLCPSCFRQYVKNPVGRSNVSAFGFSHN